MTITKDEWTPLLKSLKEKISEQGRRRLLAVMISDIRLMTLSNFGEMMDGSMRPWTNEMLVSKDYARQVGRLFATLVRTEDERARCKGTKWEGGTGEHLKDAFVTEIRADSASFTNTLDYASKHQNGEEVPRRPFFPVESNGELSNLAKQRQIEIVVEHFNLSV